MRVKLNALTAKQIMLIFALDFLGKHINVVYFGYWVLTIISTTQLLYLKKSSLTSFKAGGNTQQLYFYLTRVAPSSNPFLFLQQCYLARISGHQMFITRTQHLQHRFISVLTLSKLDWFKFMSPVSPVFHTVVTKSIGP